MSDKTDLEAKKMYFDAVQVNQYLIIFATKLTYLLHINQSLMGNGILHKWVTKYLQLGSVQCLLM